MSQFLLPILGGVLIGAAALILLAFLGRIAGISGILWNSISGLFNTNENSDSHTWRWLFLLGLLIGPVIVHVGFQMPIPLAPEGGLVLASIAGLLVGFGVKLGSGCTSGHGVCGLGRLSVRSLAATLTFMCAGMVAVFLLKHVLA